MHSSEIAVCRKCFLTGICVRFMFPMCST
jgi:hypothetical protein